MLEFLKQLFCRHEWVDIYPDWQADDDDSDIIYAGSTMFCKKCHKLSIRLYDD